MLSTTGYTVDPSQDAYSRDYSSDSVEPPADCVSQPSPFLQPLRCWLAALEIRDRTLAQTLCFLIPAQCPFERTVKLFGRTILSIPPLCKLNPFYEEFVALRFRSLCYLADVLGEDISRFC